MVFDVIIVAVDGTDTELDRLTMKCEDMTYDIDRKITIYDIGIIKMFSEVTETLGLGNVWQNWITDWGKSIEKFSLKGIISEGSKYDSLVEMMAMSGFVRTTNYKSHKNLLYIGADPDDPSDLTKYAVKAGENDKDKRIGADSAKGLECKIAKATFKHVGNLGYIEYTLEIVIGMDFELT